MGNQTVICKECGKLFNNENTYAVNICDDCFNEMYGYCDNCNEEFKYYDSMCDHNIPMANVACKKCCQRIQHKMTIWQ